MSSTHLPGETGRPRNPGQLLWNEKWKDPDKNHPPGVCVCVPLSSQNFPKRGSFPCLTSPISRHENCQHLGASIEAGALVPLDSLTLEPFTLLASFSGVSAPGGGARRADRASGPSWASGRARGSGFGKGRARSEDGRNPILRRRHEK